MSQCLKQVLHLAELSGGSFRIPESHWLRMTLCFYQPMRWRKTFRPHEICANGNQPQGTLRARLWRLDYPRLRSWIFFHYTKKVGAVYTGSS